MNRRRTKILFIPVYSFFLLWCFLLFFSGCRNGKGRLNVILIVVDTLRADHLGCYGYARNTAPNIDSLASESVFFKNAFSSSPWTTPSVKDHAFFNLKSLFVIRADFNGD